MGNQEGVLPGVTFGIVAGLTVGVEVLGQRTEFALHIQGTHTLNTCIPQFSVTLADVVETNAVFLVAQLAGNLSSSPGSNVVLHTLTYNLAFATVIGQITQLSQVVLTAQGNTTVLGKLGGQHTGSNGLVHLLGIDVFALTLQDDISQNGNTGLANHTISIVAYQVPYG